MSGETGERIRSCRVQRNISQEELAQRAGLDRSYVGSIERGEYSIRVATLTDLAQALEIDPRELVPTTTPLVRSQDPNSSDRGSTLGPSPDDVGFTIPPGYERLSADLDAFFNDNPDYLRNVFIMTRLSDDQAMRDLDTELRRSLRNAGLNPVRADDRVYPSDRDLWDNVRVYMIGCHLGVAVLEDRSGGGSNPNVSLEYGFMRAHAKPALLLVDEEIRQVQSDVSGTVYQTFDFANLEETVSRAIAHWMDDCGARGALGFGLDGFRATGHHG